MCSIGQLLRTSQTRTSSKTIDHNMNEKRRRAYVGRSSVDVSPRCTTHLLNSTMGYNVSRTLVRQTSRPLALVHDRATGGNRVIAAAFSEARKTAVFATSVRRAFQQRACRCACQHLFDRHAGALGELAKDVVALRA